MCVSGGLDFLVRPLISSNVVSESQLCAQFVRFPPQKELLYKNMVTLPCLWMDGKSKQNKPEGRRIKGWDRHSENIEMCQVGWILCFWAQFIPWFSCILVFEFFSLPEFPTLIRVCLYYFKLHFHYISSQEFWLIWSGCNADSYGAYVPICPWLTSNKETWLTAQEARSGD